MTNRDVYEGALALLAEELGDDCPDYEARAPYLLANFFGECAVADGHYRAARGESGQALDGSIPDLDEDFPFHVRFAGAGAFYLAALLCEAEDSELSDRLFARYAEEMCRITKAETPAVSGPIRDVYGFAHLEVL